MIGTTLTRPECPPSQGEGISCVGRHTLAAGLSPDFRRDKLGREECGLEDGEAWRLPAGMEQSTRVGELARAVHM